MHRPQVSGGQPIPDYPRKIYQGKTSLARGTVNARTLFGVEINFLKHWELEEELDKIKRDITGISEIKRRCLNLQSGNTLLYKRSENENGN